MDSRKPVTRIIVWVGVILLQIIATQIVTLLFSFLFSDLETFPKAHPAIFSLFLGATFTTGVFLVGWLALRQRWLPLATLYPARLAGTLVGAYLPLALGLLLGASFEAGSPIFTYGMLAAVAGFYLGGWVKK